MIEDAMFDQWIRRLAQAVGYPNRVIDLTKPGAGVTAEERRYLGLAAGVIAGKIVSLEAYRTRKERGNYGVLYCR